MFNEVFLICLGLIWIIFAVVQDWKKNEISDWLNFSLIIFALGFRFFYSLFIDANFSFFYQGLIGFGIFFVIGNLFYHSRIFAGGDAKLMIALGAVLPLSYNLFENFGNMFLFLFLFLVCGAVYGVVWSVILCSRNFKDFKKEFNKLFKKNKKMFYVVLLIAILFLVGGFFNVYSAYFGILIFIFPYLYLFAKAVDNSCMVKEISVSKLTLGDWLYQDVKVGNKVIKATWDGLTLEEINSLKKHKKKVLIRQGIPFGPVFLLAFLVWIVCIFWLGNFLF